MKLFSKRVLTMILAAAMVFSLSGMTTFAAESDDDLATFAIYCEDNSSLTFYTDDTVPAEGDTYNGKVVSTVYEDVDSLDAQSYREIPWAGDWENVTAVVIDASFAEAQPINLAYWFDNFRYASFDGFSYLDTSNVTDMTCMFYYCQAMTSLDISGWDTGNVTGLSQMFSFCSGLTSLDLSGWDVSNVTDMHNMFESCQNLESLNMAGWNTGNVERMGYLFADCENLTSLDVSGWDTANVTNMRHLFENCKSLASVDLSDWDTWNVERMDYLFANCESLTDLDVEGWDTESVTDMDSMFRGCMSLTSVDVSDWEVSGVENMANMFFGCTSLTDVDVSGWDTGLVGSMNSMFADCTSLAGVDISSWDISNVDDMIYMFQNCESLIGVDISGWDTIDLDAYVYGFARGCTSLEWVKIGENTDIFTRGQIVDQQIWYDSPMNGSIVSEDYLIDVTEPGQYWTYTEIVEAFAVYCEDDSSLTFYTDDTVPAEGDTYNGKTVTTVYEDVDSLRLTSYREVPWRSLAASVTDVVFDDSFGKAQPVSLAYWFCYFANASFSELTHIDTSNVEEMESMFFDCSEATSLDVSGWDTSNVTDMGVMFSDCYSLESITGLSDWDTSSVECMDSLFNNCFSLESVDVSNWDTSNVTQMGYMFYECDSLADIDVSNWDTSSVEWMGSMFRNCLSLAALDVSEWDTSCVTDMSNLFYQCVSLSNVDVSGWDTSHVTTMANLFIACSGLTGLDVSNWDTSSVTNMDSLFDSCTSLSNVDVSNWDTSNVKWMEYTFADCESLTSLDLSRWDTGNVTYCENFATGCPALEWVAIGENTDIFTKGQVVDQQTWYDSPTNGNIVSEDYLMDVTEPGQYWTYTDEVVYADIPVIKDGEEIAVISGDAFEAAQEAAPEQTFTHTTGGRTIEFTARFVPITELLGDNLPDEGCGFIATGGDGYTSTYTADDLGDVYLFCYRDDDSNSLYYDQYIYRTAIDGSRAYYWVKDVVGITLGHVYENGVCTICGAKEPTPEPEPGVDKEVLEAAIEAAEAINEDDYTPESWAPVAAALANAKAVDADPDATQGAVDEAVDALLEAIAALPTPGPIPVVDKTALLNEVEEDMMLSENDYTAESWELFETALSKAVSVVAEPDATQDEVDEALLELQTAKDNLEPVTPPEVKDGLIKDSDGVWRLYKDNVFQENYTGYAENTNGKWYVVDGCVLFDVTDILKDKNGAIGTSGDWYYVIGSKVQENFTGLSNFSNQNGWWYIKEGKVDFTRNSVDHNVNGWWYVVGGKVQFGFTGLANYKNENGWWYIKNGAVDFNHNGVDRNVNGWWYVTGGKVQFGFTGLANYRNDHGWWYIESGKVNFNHTGVEKNVNGWWYVKDSKVDFSYTGTASNRYGTWNIVNGKVRFS